MIRFLDGFRDPTAARALGAEIEVLGARLSAAGRSVTLMEVCGTHTMAISRFGIRSMLPDSVSLVSGPGCPVCVTPPGYLDAAIDLARRGIHLCTFGDMVRVPASNGAALEGVRASGGVVQVCYSPGDAVTYAREHPDVEVVFLAIGFETTLAPTVSILLRPDLPRNFSMLTAFKLVPPALRALMADPGIAIDAFLCPAHVSVITGAEVYREFSGPEGVPCVIAGFEPLDILSGIRAMLMQLLEGRAEVENEYERVVSPEGNVRAQAVMAQTLTPVDADWRGIGSIPSSGMALREAFHAYDAARRFELEIGPGEEPGGCACGVVIKGHMAPKACPLFGTRCTPATPVGPCMVSTEGSCAAAFQYET